MPFITAENRQKMLDYLRTGEKPMKQIHPAVCVPDIEPGDWTFLFYREMMIVWKKRDIHGWTTTHNIRKHLEEQICSGYFEFTIDDKKFAIGASSSHPHYIENWKDVQIAYRLAWEVFFNLDVMDYEGKKLLENGEVEV